MQLQWNKNIEQFTLCENAKPSMLTLYIVLIVDVADTPQPPLQYLGDELILECLPVTQDFDSNLF